MTKEIQPTPDPNIGRTIVGYVTKFDLLRMFSLSPLAHHIPLRAPRALVFGRRMDVKSNESRFYHGDCSYKIQIKIVRKV